MKLLPKLVGLMTLVAAVPLALAGASAIRLSQSATREQVGDAQQRLAENLADSVRGFETDQLQTLVTISRVFDWEKLSKEEQRGALKLLYFQIPAVDLMTLVDAGKNEIVDPVASGPDEKVPEAVASRARRAPADVERFYAALDAEHALSGGASASALYDPSGPRGPHQAIAVAVDKTRVLAAEISFEKVRAQLNGFHIGEHGEAFLVSERGRVLVHPDAARIGEDLLAVPFVAERLKDPARAVAAGEMKTHGVDWLAAYAPVGVAGMGLMVAQPADDALRGPNRLFGQTVVWTVCALLFAMALAIFYAREVSRPVRAASEGARAFAGGDLKKRIPGDFGSDEIGDLSRSFNEMAARLEASIQEIERQNDEIRGWNVTLSQKVDDRTRELREAQAQLIQSKKLAALAELGAGLAHELNNPLAAIKGFAQLLLMSAKPEDKAFAKLQSIADQSKRCAEIVQKLLRYSQQAQQEKKEKVDISVALEEALSVVEQRLKDEKIEVDRGFGFGVPAILASPGELREVFWHLISNARAAMAKGGKLSVSSWREVAPDGTDRVNVSFRDTGRGIAPDILDRIFEPFFTTKDEWRGTGLGLAIVHRVVTDHGGTIAVESKVGAGSCFTLTFPAWSAEGQSREGESDDRALRAKTQLV